MTRTKQLSKSDFVYRRIAPMEYTIALRSNDPAKIVGSVKRQCGATWDACEASLKSKHVPCCGGCKNTATHPGYWEWIRPRLPRPPREISNLVGGMLAELNKTNIEALVIYESNQLHIRLDKTEAGKLLKRLSDGDSTSE